MHFCRSWTPQPVIFKDRGGGVGLFTPPSSSLSSSSSLIPRLAHSSQICIQTCTDCSHPPYLHHGGVPEIQEEPEIDGLHAAVYLHCRCLAPAAPSREHRAPCPNQGSPQMLSPMFAPDVRTLGKRLAEPPDYPSCSLRPSAELDGVVEGRSYDAGGRRLSFPQTSTECIGV
jgi:hypothetical protein